jgi:hypothetical protein
MMNLFVTVSFTSLCADKSLQDNAALAMIERSADAWDHNQFKEVVVRVANVEMWVPQTPLSACV